MNPQLKMKFYYDHVLGTVYTEGESSFHQAVTNDVIDRFIQPMGLDQSAKILDLGCGPGYFLDRMKELGYNNTEGVTLSIDDHNTCVAHGHRIRRADMNFLADRDETVDMLFCRHSLEHSPFPYITLLEYNRVLRPGGRLYVEVPQPDCEQQHENNRNHFSILGRTMWLSLLQRTGFDVTWHEYQFPITFQDGREPASVLEKYYIFVCTRRRAVDIK